MAQLKNTYWDNKGKFQAEYDQLIRLMPKIGNSDVLAGELIRSANMLVWEFYNNGFNNNCSGATNFLLQHYAISDQNYDTIHPYTIGAERYRGRYNGDPLQVAIEEMVDNVVEFVFKNHKQTFCANDDDMDNYYEEDAV